MFSGKNQSGQAPTAFGSMLQASTYGMTIPVIYGRTISPALATWANNLRQGGSDKKLKQLKKGITAYCENIDFLLGKNPILGTLQFYVNNSKYPLNFIRYSCSGPGQMQVGNFGGHPDPNFYAVIGVTINKTYSETFNDYGSSGPRTLSGTYEVPMWNECMAGPDPTGNSAYRNFPYCYRWQPSYGPHIFVDFPDFFVDTFNIYYAQLSSATRPDTPLSKLRLHFEARLGDGDEYDGFSSEQIIYDDYAGIGSASIDLGSSGTIPSIKPEVQGKFGLYPSGDGDHVDFIEDIIKSGITQAALGGSVGFGATQHGVGCFDYPGCIQVKVNASVEEFTQGPQIYNLPVTEGNYLIAVAFTDGLDPAPVTVSDTLGNTWSPLLSVLNQPAWYAKANASGVCSVTFGGPLGHDWHTALFEVAGVDTLDSISIGSPDTGDASITTTNVAGWPGYLLSVAFYSGGGIVPQTVTKWNNLLPVTINGSPGDSLSMQERTVYSPATYSIKLPTVQLLGHCIIAFKGSTAPNYPRPGGDFLDQPSADLTRLQCRAGGLWGSLAMISQKAASEWIKDLVAAANCAPVWSGFRLKLIPRSEVSAVGNGAVYIAPTAAGPVADLDADKGDFIGTTPIQAVRTARTDLDTVLQMQHMNRNSDYQQVVTADADPASIARYGTRKADPIVNNAIQDVAVAQPILRIMTRRQNYVDPLCYKFKLNARWGLLEAMDLVTITDRQQGIVKVPVRLTSVEEDDKFENDCEAEPFFYGVSAPQTIAVTEPTSYRPNINGQVGGGLQINPPIIFEATPRLAQQSSPAQLWVVTSAQGAEYGGCDCFISTDGGLSYNPASTSPTIGSSMQANVGTTPTQGWPPGTDPDTTNDLFLSFAETLPNPPGTLPSFSATQRDNFQYPCFVGFNNEATLEAVFSAGDTSQITELGVLFSDPTILNALPSDASIVNIFPMAFIDTGPNTSPGITNLYSGTGLTPTSGGTLFEGPIPGGTAAPVPLGGGSGVGTSLTGQEVRYNLKLNATGPGATGKIIGIGWAIYYGSATPFIDPNTIIPFSPSPGFGFGWAIPKTVATGTVGTGTNATVSGFGGIPPTGIPYELMTYDEATLLGPGTYQLMATGAGNELRRGVYGAPAPGAGMNHPPGSPFALLNPAGTGIFKINMDPAWIGTQLWFKFVTFNKFGSQLTGLQDADFFLFTPTGIPGNIGPSTGGFLVEGS